LTLGRSGSNTLVDILNQNAALLNYGEVLGEWTKPRKAAWLIARGGDDKRLVGNLLRDPLTMRAANMARSLGKMRNDKAGERKNFEAIQSVGIKEFAFNFQRFGLADWIVEQDLSVVGMLRSDTIDRYVSNMRLTQSKVWAVERGAKVDKVDLVVDPATALEDMRKIQQENDDLKAMLDQIPDARKYVMEYGDFFGSEQQMRADIAAATDLIGVENHDFSIRMRKIINEPITQTISNFGDLEKALAGSEFEEGLALKAA
jgi:hypothetical protein